MRLWGRQVGCAAVGGGREVWVLEGTKRQRQSEGEEGVIIAPSLPPARTFLALLQAQTSLELASLAGDCPRSSAHTAWPLSCFGAMRRHWKSLPTH